MESFDQKVAELKKELAWDSPSFNDASLRLEQCVLHAPSSNEPFQVRFRKEWKSTLAVEFIPLLEAAVCADALSKRCSAVVTLGRIGAKQSVECLRGVFEQALIDDPLLIQHLLQEISWLTESASRIELAEKIASAEAWTTRWVVFLIDPVGGDETTERRLPEIQRQLIGDAHPIIASKAESEEANLFFSKVDQVFRNRVWKRGDSYTVNELGKFIESFQLDEC